MIKYYKCTTCKKYEVHNQKQSVHNQLLSSQYNFIKYSSDPTKMGVEMGPNVYSNKRKLGFCGSSEN